MVSPEERKVIERIIWRLDIEVVKQMKQIPSNQLFGWKLNDESELFERKAKRIQNKKEV